MTLYRASPGGALFLRRSLNRNTSQWMRVGALQILSYSGMFSYKRLISPVIRPSFVPFVVSGEASHRSLLGSIIDDVGNNNLFYRLNSLE